MPSEQSVSDTERSEDEPKYGWETCDNCGGEFPVNLMPHGVRPNLCRDCERVGA